MEYNYYKYKRKEKLKKNKKWIGYVILILSFFVFLIIMNYQIRQINIEPNRVISKMIIEEDDMFKNSTELHYGKMPIKYSIDSSCSGIVKSQVEKALDTIENSTDNIVRFKEDNSDYQLNVTCQPYENANLYGSDEYSETIALGEYITSASNDKLIYSGHIIIFGDSWYCGTGFPATEIHEILHTFGFEHNPLKNSVMYPYAADSSNSCFISKINDEYTNCLKYIYSNEQEGSVCYFPNKYT